MSYYAIGKYYIAETCVGGSAQFHRITIGGNHTIGDRPDFIVFCLIFFKSVL